MRVNDKEEIPHFYRGKQYTCLAHLNQYFNIKVKNNIYGKTYLSSKSKGYKFYNVYFMTSLQKNISFSRQYISTRFGEILAIIIIVPVDLVERHWQKLLMIYLLLVDQKVYIKIML